MNHDFKSQGGTAVECEQQVRAWLDVYFSAVERRDLPAFLSCFEVSESFQVFENGDVYGWKEFEAFATNAFQFIVKVRLELERCYVDAVAPEFAVATGVFRGAGEDASGKPVKVRSAFTFVLHKIGNEWKVRHIHESPLA